MEGTDANLLDWSYQARAKATWRKIFGLSSQQRQRRSNWDGNPLPWAPCVWSHKENLRPVLTHICSMIIPKKESPYSLSWALWQKGPQQKGPQNERQQAFPGCLTLSMLLQARRPDTSWHVQYLPGFDMPVSETIVASSGRWSCRRKETMKG